MTETERAPKIIADWTVGRYGMRTVSVLREDGCVVHVSRNRVNGGITEAYIKKMVR